MREELRFDLMGQIRLVFDDEAVTWHTKEIWPIPLPYATVRLTFVRDQPIRYRDIRWVGSIRRRQKWTLPVAILGLLLGGLWTVGSWGDWGPFGFGAAVLVLLGLWPLGLFIRGRRFLAIASDTEAICFPSDRKKRKVRRAIELLKERCPEAVRWHL